MDLSWLCYWPLPPFRGTLSPLSRPPIFISLAKAQHGVWSPVRMRNRFQ